MSNSPLISGRKRDRAVSSTEFCLDKAEQGCSYLIVSNAAAGRNRMRMDSLGLIPGDVVHVLFRNFSGLVVAIKGSRLALGRPLAAQLTVRAFKDDDRSLYGAS